MTARQIRADVIEAAHGECPGCGASVRHAPVRDSGWTEDSLPIQLRVCKTCGTRFTTAIVNVPASFYRLNQAKKDAGALARRRKYGWRAGTRARLYPSSPRIRALVGVKEVPPT